MEATPESRDRGEPVPQSYAIQGEGAKSAYSEPGQPSPQSFDGRPLMYQSVVVRPSGYVTVRCTTPEGVAKSVGGWPSSCSASSIPWCQMGPAPVTPITSCIGELSLLPAQTPIT